MYLLSFIPLTHSIQTILNFGHFIGYDHIYAARFVSPPLLRVTYFILRTARLVVHLSIFYFCALRG